MTTSEIDAGVKVYDLPVGRVDGGFNVPLNSLRLGGAAGGWVVEQVSLLTVDISRISDEVMESCTMTSAIYQESNWLKRQLLNLEESSWILKLLVTAMEEVPA